MHASLSISSLTPLILSLYLSLRTSLQPSLSLSASLSGQRFTIAPFLHLFIHITLLIGIDLRPPTKILQVNVVVLRGIDGLGPCQGAQEMTQGFSDNGPNAGTVVLCHGKHCYASLRRHGAGDEQRSTAWSAECELPKGSGTFTDHSSKLPFLTQNTNSVANRSLERIN